MSFSLPSPPRCECPAWPPAGQTVIGSCIRCGGQPQVLLTLKRCCARISCSCDHTVLLNAAPRAQHCSAVLRRNGSIPRATMRCTSPGTQSQCNVLMATRSQNVLMATRRLPRATTPSSQREFRDDTGLLMKTFSSLRPHALALRANTHPQRSNNGRPHCWNRRATNSIERVGGATLRALTLEPPAPYNRDPEP